MNIEMTVVYCANCHLPFAITDDLRERLLKSHSSFYCPMGHGNHYGGKSDEEKLREQLREKKSLLNETKTQLETLQKSLKKKTAKREKKAEYLQPNNFVLGEE